VDFAAEQQAQFILRGVRSVQDFEYERNIAEANKQLSGIETILLYTRPEYAHISSTLLRDLHAHNKDITPYLPPKQ
jgi:pantetheine-phosphate adenylyltransferase